jgi:hypothetical protein
MPKPPPFDLPPELLYTYFTVQSAVRAFQANFLAKIFVFAKMGRLSQFRRNGVACKQ